MASIVIRHSLRRNIIDYETDRNKVMSELLSEKYLLKNIAERTISNEFTVMKIKTVIAIVWLPAKDSVTINNMNLMDWLILKIMYFIHYSHPIHIIFMKSIGNHSICSQ